MNLPRNPKGSPKGAKGKGTGGQFASKPVASQPPIHNLEIEHGISAGSTQTQKVLWDYRDDLSKYGQILPLSFWAAEGLVERHILDLVLTKEYENLAINIREEDGFWVTHINSFKVPYEQLGNNVARMLGGYPSTRDYLDIVIKDAKEFGLTSLAWDAPILSNDINNIKLSIQESLFYYNTCAEQHIRLFDQFVKGRVSTQTTGAGESLWDLHNIPRPMLDYGNADRPHDIESIFMEAKAFFREFENYHTSDFYLGLQQALLGTNWQEWDTGQHYASHSVEEYWSNLDAIVNTGRLYLELLEKYEVACYI